MPSIAHDCDQQTSSRLRTAPAGRQLVLARCGSRVQINTLVEGTLGCCISRSVLKTWFGTIAASRRDSLWTGTVAGLTVEQTGPRDYVVSTGDGGSGVFSHAEYEAFCRGVVDNCFGDFIVPWRGLMAVSDERRVIKLLRANQPNVYLEFLDTDFAAIVDRLPSNPLDLARLFERVPQSLLWAKPKSDQAAYFWLLRTPPQGYSLVVSAKELKAWYDQAQSGAFAGLVG